MELRKINTADAFSQWEYTTALPENENGLTNPYHGVSYEEYRNRVLPELLSYENPVNMPAWFVPETYYYLWDGDILVGEFRLRHYLTPALRTGSGHIGYSIAASWRGRGYATEGLRRLLLAKEIVPEDEIYLRVNKSNPASGSNDICLEYQLHISKLKHPSRFSLPLNIFVKQVLYSV